MGKVASCSNNSATNAKSESETQQVGKSPRKALAVTFKTSGVPKPRRPYKSMVQSKLLMKHELFHGKLQLAQKRMENVKAKFDRFEAEIKLRSTAVTLGEQGEGDSVDEVVSSSGGLVRCASGLQDAKNSDVST